MHPRYVRTATYSGNAATRKLQIRVIHEDHSGSLATITPELAALRATMLERLIPDTVPESEWGDLVTDEEYQNAPTAVSR